MSKFKNVLTGIKDQVSKQGLNIPHFEKVNPENATNEDVLIILSELRTIKSRCENPPQFLNLPVDPVKVEVLGRAIDEITCFPGEDFY